MKVNRITEAFLRLFHKEPLEIPKGDWSTPNKPTESFGDILKKSNKANTPAPSKLKRISHKNTAFRYTMKRRNYG